MSQGKQGTQKAQSGVSFDVRLLLLQKRGRDSLAPSKNRGSLFSRALYEGLSAYLPPTALAALECTSAELNATHLPRLSLVAKAHDPPFHLST